MNHQQGSKLAGHAHAIVPAGGTLTVEVRFSPQNTGGSVCRFRRHVRQPHRRSRRFLCTRSTRHARPKMNDWSCGKPLPACSGRNSTTTTTCTAGSRAIPPQPHAARRALERTQLALEGTAQRRRDPDARHLGVSLVRRLGSLAFHCVAMAHIDPDIRQAATAADGLRMVSARQRSISGLRMGL